MKGKQLNSITTVSAGDERETTSIKSLLDVDTSRSAALKKTLLMIVALVIVFVVWAFLAEVEELTKARGEIKPVSEVQQLQSEEGGLIDEILVTADEFVEVGQVVARFMSTNIHKDRAQMMIRRAALQVNLERWGALADGRQPDFSSFENYPELVAESKSLYQNQLALNEATLESKKQTLSQLQTQLVGYQSQIPSSQRELTLVKEVYQRQRDALRDGVVSDVQVAEAEQRVASTERTLLELKSKVADAQKAILVAKADVNQQSNQLVEQALEERNEILEQIAEISEEILALDTRQGRREIIAPVAGYIQNIPETRKGAVIEPGGLVAEIVPSEGGVYMEAKLSAKDIGFVQVGQKAIVKIDAYDFSRFGAVNGSVTAISPSSFKNERDDSSYYKVEIALEQQYIDHSPKRHFIPGMTGEVDVVTGSKTVFQYLAKPVFVNIDTAFSER